QVGPLSMKVADTESDARSKLLLELHVPFVVVFAIAPSFTHVVRQGLDREGLAEQRIVDGQAFTVGAEVRKVAIRHVVAVVVPDARRRLDDRRRRREPLLAQ